MEYNKFQKKFLELIGDSQEEIIQIALSKYKDGDNIENLLYNVTYDIIVDIMEMIDGYKGFESKLEVIDTESGEKLKDNPYIELHDSVCDFIKYETNNDNKK